MTEKLPNSVPQLPEALKRVSFRKRIRLFIRFQIFKIRMFFIHRGILKIRLLVFRFGEVLQASRIPVFAKTWGMTILQRIRFVLRLFWNHFLRYTWLPMYSTLFFAVSMTFLPPYLKQFQQPSRETPIAVTERPSPMVSEWKLKTRHSGEGYPFEKGGVLSEKEGVLSEKGGVLHENRGVLHENRGKVPRSSRWAILKTAAPNLSAVSTSVTSQVASHLTIKLLHQLFPSMAPVSNAYHMYKFYGNVVGCFAGTPSVPEPAVPGEFAANSPTSPPSPSSSRNSITF